MGSGASQEIGSKLKDNSAEDLQKLFKDLPADELEKVIKAAVAVQDSGNGEDSAPYLRKAFALLADMLQKEMEAEEEGKEMEMDAEKAEETYKGLIKQSFEHHDKKKTGKLDKEDAALFFKHFLQESNVFVEATMAKMIKMKMAACKKELEEDCMSAKDEYPTAKDHLPGAMKAAQAEWDKMLLVAKAQAKGRSEAFAANKDALSAVAFAGTDEDGDGSLTLEEFAELMNMGSEKNEMLQKSLGMDFEKIFDDDKLEKCMEAAKEAVGLHMKEKLGIKDE